MAYEQQSKVFRAREALDIRLDELDDEMRDLRRVVHKLDELAVTARRALDDVGELSQRYGQADPDLLVRPLIPGDGEPNDGDIPGEVEVDGKREAPALPAADGAPEIDTSELELELED